MRKEVILHSFQQMSALSFVVQLERSVRKFLVKLPDQIWTFFFLLVHRPWSMQRFSFRCVGQEGEFTFIFLLHTVPTQTFVELATRSLVLVSDCMYVRGGFKVASTIQCVILISTIFGCLSVLVSCKARTHIVGGGGGLKPCVKLCSTTHPLSLPSVPRTRIMFVWLTLASAWIYQNLSRLMM